MEISAVSNGSSFGPQPLGSASTSASKKASDSMGLNKALNQGAIVSGLLPALSSDSGSSGSAGFSTGLSADIYTAVGMQAQGMMSRGLMGIQIANASLGIDMSQAGKEAAAAKEAEKEAGPAADSDPETAAGAAGAGTEASAAPRYYSNPDLSNPALGGLLNSLG